MDKIQIEENFSVSGQITLDDIKELSDNHVKVIICNRPEGEEPHQITCKQIKDTAVHYGIEFVHIPVTGREIPPESLSMFMGVIDRCDEKIHAYCKTGMRSSIFWALCYARHHSTESVLTKANALGINLTPVTNQIEAISQKQRKQ